jgi:hypothetical protein
MILGYHSYEIANNELILVIDHGGRYRDLIGWRKQMLGR